MRVFLFLISSIVLLHLTTKNDIREELKEQNVYDRMINRLESKGIKCPEVVFAQILKETNFLKSKIYKENKNPFGMKFNRRGWASSINRGHAAYSKFDDALEDYAEWQSDKLKAYENKYGKVNTNEQYLHFLDHLVINNKEYRYAEDPGYTKSLREYYIPFVQSLIN